MGYRKYLQNSNGKTIMDVNKIPDGIFLDATKILDIAQIKIISRDIYPRYNIQKGGNDVLIMSNTGEQGIISRQELVTKYKHLNGKKISMIKLKNNVAYKVVGVSNANYKVMRIPNGVVVASAKGMVGGNNYITAKADESGAIIRQSISVVPVEVFKRQFKIPMQDAISKLRDHKMNKNMHSNTVPQQSKLMQDIIARKLNQNNANQPQPSESQKSVNVVSQQEYRFSMLRQVVDNHDKLIGFEMLDRKENKKIALGLGQVSQIAGAKAIDNAVLVTTQDGRQFLRGKDIQLSNLPKVISSRQM